MHLLDLPVELIAALPVHLWNIEDFNNLRSTCRTLRSIFEDTRPETILRLADASAPTFFSPHPHFLVVATARQVSNWAIGNEGRTQELKKSFQGGIDGLYDLCLDKAGITLQDIRRLHQARFDIFNPLADTIDKMAGEQWYQTPNFWNGGVSEPYTIFTEANRATFQLIIYGELFATTMRAHLEPEKNLPTFNRLVRVEYIKYCIPDWICRSYEGFEVINVGPYENRNRATGANNEDGNPADQVALHHILGCGRWRRLWQSVTRAVGPDFEHESQQSLWWNAVHTLGLEGMELVTAEDKDDGLKTRGLSEKWKGRLLEIYHLIEALDEQNLHPHRESRYRRLSSPPDDDLPPMVMQEVHTCCCTMWG